MNHHTHSNILFGFLGTSVDIIYSLKYIGHLNELFETVGSIRKNLNWQGLLINLELLHSNQLISINSWQNMLIYGQLWKCCQQLVNTVKEGLVCFSLAEVRFVTTVATGSHEKQFELSSFFSSENNVLSCLICSKYKICYVSLDTPSLIFLILDAVTLFYSERK